MVRLYYYQHRHDLYACQVVTQQAETWSLMKEAEEDDVWFYVAKDVTASHVFVHPIVNERLVSSASAVAAESLPTEVVLFCAQLCVDHLMSRAGDKREDKTVPIQVNYVSMHQVDDTSCPGKLRIGQYRHVTI